MLEAIILVIILFYFMEPEWLGKHLAKSKLWYDYYLDQGRSEVRRDVAKQRLKRIRKKYPDAFRKKR